jgi:hypothetical protein
MSRTIEEPVVTKEQSSCGETTTTTHPAFGQIGASRVSGRTTLYGSDFQHNAFMTIRISRSELRRDLNRDWHFSREKIIEVALSEAQWATFVSSPNVGSGVPCTIQALHMRTVPGIPEPQSRVDQFSDETKAALAECLVKLDSALAEVGSLGLSKVKAARVTEHLQRVRRNLSSTIPFVAKQFSEHMEETVEKAKVEIHGYMTGVLNRAGLDAIANGTLPLQIENKSAAKIGGQK